VPTSEFGSSKAKPKRLYSDWYYHDDQIFEELIARQFDPPIAVLAENGTYTVLAPEVFEPQGDKLTIRGGSVQLLALLELGGGD